MPKFPCLEAWRNIIGDAILCILRYYKPILGEKLFFTKLPQIHDIFTNFHRNRKIYENFVRMLLVMHFLHFKVLHAYVWRKKFLSQNNPKFWFRENSEFRKKIGVTLFALHQYTCMPIFRSISHSNTKIWRKQAFL